LQLPISKSLNEIFAVTESTFPESGFESLQDMYAHWQVQENGLYWKSNDVSEHVRKLISTTFSEGENCTVEIDTILDELVYDKYLNNKNNDEI